MNDTYPQRINPAFTGVFHDMCMDDVHRFMDFKVAGTLDIEADPDSEHAHVHQKLERLGEILGQPHVDGTHKPTVVEGRSKPFLVDDVRPHGPETATGWEELHGKHAVVPMPQTRTCS